MMTRSLKMVGWRLVLPLAGAVLFLYPAATQAQGVVGRGFILDAPASVSTAQAEVISGKGSIKASYPGPAGHTLFLHTDPAIFPLKPNRPYTIDFKYRILTSGSAGIEVLFWAADAPGLTSRVIAGAAGDSGSATLTSTLASSSAFEAQWKVVSTGAFVIDDIQITEADTGALVAAEDGEGRRITPGPLNFQILDSKNFSGTALGMPVAHQLRDPVVSDLDGDGAPELVLTLTQYPDQTPNPVVILGTSPTLSLDTPKFFPAGPPKIRNSLHTVFADLNGDGLKDILIAESGLDHPPWTGSGIGVGLNRGRGVYDDVSPLVPAEVQIGRSDALAVADLDGDGRSEVLLPDQNGTNQAILRWNGNGFTVQRDLIDARLWGAPTNLKANEWVGFADLDGDGRQDLVVGGQFSQPSVRILFGNTTGFTTQALVLPDGPFGHNAAAPSVAIPVVQGGDVDRVVVADFNNDGRPDLFALEEQAIRVAPGALTDTNVPAYAALLKDGGTYYGDVGVQVLINNGARQFTDASATSSTRNLGRVVYFGLAATDLNNDGFLDLVGIYHRKAYGSDPGTDWGTTFFLNDGTGAFQVVDGSQLLPLAITNPPSDKRWNLGSFVPTSVAPDRTEGVAIEVINGHGGSVSLNVYKLVANRTIGTGPNVADSASLGVPGFNEFYYLRTHPEVAAAVERGEYRSGLEHYLVEGRAKGYAMHAPNARQNER